MKILPWSCSRKRSSSCLQWWISSLGLRHGSGVVGASPAVLLNTRLPCCESWAPCPFSNAPRFSRCRWCSCFPKADVQSDAPVETGLGWQADCRLLGGPSGKRTVVDWRSWGRQRTDRFSRRPNHNGRSNLRCGGPRLASKPSYWMPTTSTLLCHLVSRLPICSWPPKDGNGHRRNSGAHRRGRRRSSFLLGFVGFAAD